MTASMVVMALLALACAVPSTASAAVLADYALSWGTNASGQLGDGTTDDRTTPGAVLLPEGVELTAVAAGFDHSLAVTSEGRVLAWGSNTFGQLGDGTMDDHTTPIEVSLPAGVTVTGVAGGLGHSIAVTSDGQVLTWGNNVSGQLGDGTTTERLVPGPVTLPAGVTVTAVAANYLQSLALTSDGRVLAWGYNDFGQLGDGTTTSRSLPVFSNLPAGVTVSAIAAGNHHSLALTSTGTVLAWGYNAFGQLGDGTTTGQTTPVPTTLPPGVTLSAIAANGFHSLGLTSTGRVLAWGSNGFGQIGDGTMTNRTTPVESQVPADVTVTAIAAGFGHSLALTTDGRVMAWGDNDFGQIGDGTRTGRTTPVFALVPESLTALALAAHNHTLALVRRAASEIGLTATPTRTTEGDPVTFTARVTCTAGTPTGTVAFFEEGQQIGTGTVNSAGVATLTTSDLSAGEHQVVARYLGDGDCSAATSNTVTVTIVAPSELAVTKEASRSVVRVGDKIRYTITIRNNGGETLGPVSITDDLGQLRPYARLIGQPTASSGDVSVTSRRLRWTGTLAADAAVRITYTVKAICPGRATNTVRWDGQSTATTVTILSDHKKKWGNDGR
ncbi:Ig-like domain repeat protein [Actinocorallia sp. A-T 12471]|uniref:RCC1 domain-containing protein n=1 Tax=Actinocorallia sp. A-T 12471 TaxID=3089813 RepID=UPI0029D2F46E|nr:Ig-like domain repeat protein [Actinocorallia sp. A-T 12471]MDX6740857.1 Ig-like domain repeat protein [Actinocorallia sp. A-T 12471]